MSDLEPVSESNPPDPRASANPPRGPDTGPRITSGWPEIDAALFDDGRGAAPDFPLELLPQPWRGWVADTAIGAGAPSAYVAQALLAAVAGLCGAGAVVRLAPAWTEPLVLWQALVGRPSSGKSPALAPVRSLLATLQEELAKGAAEGEKPFCLLADGAAETLASALAAAPRGVMLWRDEPSGRLAFLDDSAAKDRSRWLEAWQAGPVVLQGARHVSRHARCPMSVLVSIRPDGLKAALGHDDPREEDAPKGKRRHDEDGLAARLLYGWPDPPPFRPIAERRAARDEQMLDLLRSIGKVARSLANPLVLALDEPAAKAFNAFLAELHGLLQHAEGLEASWMGKSSGTVARLAGVLALIAWAGSGVGGAPGKIGLEFDGGRGAPVVGLSAPARLPGVRSHGPHRHRASRAPRGALAESPSPGRGLARGCAAPRAPPRPRRRPHRARARSPVRRRGAPLQAARLLRGGRAAGAPLGGQPGLAGCRRRRQRKMSGGNAGNAGNLNSLGNRAVFEAGANRRKLAQIGGNSLFFNGAAQRPHSRSIGTDELEGRARLRCRPSRAHCVRLGERWMVAVERATPPSPSPRARPRAWPWSWP